MFAAFGLALFVLLLALGLPKAMGDPVSDMAARAGLNDVLADYNQRTGEAFSPVTLPGGYNCTGYAWIGGEMTHGSQEIEKVAVQQFSEFVRVRSSVHAVTWLSMR